MSSAAPTTSSATTSASNTSLPPPRPLVGVAVLVVSSAHPGCLLVGERKGSHGAKTFATPGGHLEYGEEWEECARRELKEETNLDLAPSIQHVATTNNVFPEVSKHYITLFMRGELSSDSAPLQLMEPEKCVEWVWMEWEELKKKAKSGEILVFRPLMSLLNDPSFTFRDVDL